MFRWFSCAQVFVAPRVSVSEWYDSIRIRSGSMIIETTNIQQGSNLRNTVSLLKRFWKKMYVCETRGFVGNADSGWQWCVLFDLFWRDRRCERAKSPLQSLLAEDLIPRQDPLDGIVLEDLHRGAGCSFATKTNCYICQWMCQRAASLRCIGSSMPLREEAQNDLQRPQSPLRWMQLSLQIYDWMILNELNGVKWYKWILS